MDGRSAAQNLWRAACGWLDRFKQIVAENGSDDDMVFEDQDPPPDRDDDLARRIAEARKDRVSGRH